LWIRLGALVDVVVDLLALVSPVADASAWTSTAHRGDLQPAEHALAGVDSVVDRVQTNMAIAANELDLDHDEVVDMVQVLSNNVLGMPAVVPLDHEVTAGALADPVEQVIRKDELAVVPLNLDLLAWLTTTTGTP
jgi:hypothetical protein